MKDPLIDEIRRVRREISNEVGSDLDSLVARYASLEPRFAKAPLTPSDRRKRDGGAVNKDASSNVRN